MCLKLVKSLLLFTKVSTKGFIEGFTDLFFWCNMIIVTSNFPRNLKKIMYLLQRMYMCRWIWFCSLKEYNNTCIRWYNLHILKNNFCSFLFHPRQRCFKKSCRTFVKDKYMILWNLHLGQNHGSQWVTC